MHQIGTHVLIIHLMGEIDQLKHTTNNNDPWMNVSDPHRTNKFKWRRLQKWISCTFIDEIVTQLKGGRLEPGLPFEKLQHVEGNWHATDLILPSIFAINWVLCGSYHTCRFLAMWGGIPMHVNESNHTTYGKSKHNAFFFNKIFTYFFPFARTISQVLDKFHVYNKVVL